MSTWSCRHERWRFSCSSVLWIGGNGRRDEFAERKWGMTGSSRRSGSVTIQTVKDGSRACRARAPRRSAFTERV